MRCRIDQPQAQRRAEMKISALETLALSALRIVVGFMFSLHGLQKVFGFPQGHRAQLLSLLWVAGTLEALGGSLIFFGLFVRPVAFVLCGEMAVAYFRAHAPKGFYPILNGGELAVLYCFIFLCLVFSGAGAWSVDALWRRKK
jgi:putative oxidoreductase